MPRLRVNAPQEDSLKALVLQRKQALKLKYSEIAEAIGISRQKLYAMLNKQSSDEWTLGELKKLCRVLWITADEMKGAIKCTMNPH